MTPALSSRIFEFFFLTSLAVFPLFFGGVNLWGFSFGAALLCGAFAVYWFRHPLSSAGILRTDLDGWVAAYVGFFLLSLAFSKIPYFSWVELFKLAVVLCAFLATRYLCCERTQIYRLTEWFVFLGGLLSAIGLLQFVGGLQHDWWSRSHLLSSTYVNHNHFAGFLVLILPIAFGLVIAERDRSKKVFFIFLTTLMGVAFVFALSRGALVALGVSAVWMMWVLKKRALVSSAVAPFAVFLALVVCAVVVFGTESITQRVEDIRMMNQEEELSLKFRWLTWLGTLPMIRHFLWFGSGPGTFEHLFLAFRPADAFSMRPVYAHNDYLHLLAECGIFAYLAMAGLIITFFRKGLRIIRRDDSRLRIGVGSGILAGALGFLTHALFDFNFHIPANWLLLTVAAGLLFSMDEDRFYASKKLSLSLKVLISSVLLAALGAAFYLGISDYAFWEAKSLLKEHDRKGALAAVEKSLRMNPFSAESHYLKGFIRSSEKAPQAAKDLDEAIRLNGYEPVYDLARARALAPLLAGSPTELLRPFQSALAKDPNNAVLAFTVAREILARDSARGPFLREAAEKILEKTVELDPSFSEKVFQILWRHKKNIPKIFAFYERSPKSLAGLVAFLEGQDLWRHHRKYHLKLLGIDPDADKQKTSDDLWRSQPSEVFALKDFSHPGPEAVNTGEFFFSNGELIKKVNIYNPLERLVLRAKGSPAKNVFPVLYVKIDGKIVDEYYINSKVFKNYYTDLKLSPGPHLLSLEYVNDVKNKGLTGEDRNVWIQKVFFLGT